MDNDDEISPPPGRSESPVYRMRPRDPSLLVPKARPEATTEAKANSTQDTQEEEEENEEKETEYQHEGWLAWDGDQPIFHCAIHGGAPYGTVEVQEGEELDGAVLPGRYPLRPDGTIDWGLHTRNGMVEDNGSYPMRWMPDGIGRRRQWMHPVSKAWMHWSIKAEIPPHYAEYRGELDDSMLEEHICHDCDDWFDCAGTHTNILGCACFQKHYPTGNKYYCRQSCHQNTNNARVIKIN